LVDEEGVSVKNGVGVVVLSVDVVLKPVVVNPGARFLDAVGFHLHIRFLHTGEVIVRLVFILAVSWKIFHVYE